MKRRRRQLAAAATASGMACFRNRQRIAQRGGMAETAAWRIRRRMAAAS